MDMKRNGNLSTSSDSPGVRSLDDEKDREDDVP